jgi:tetratricopeptide (TPR) repeat protein
MSQPKIRWLLAALACSTAACSGIALAQAYDRPDSHHQHGGQMARSGGNFGELSFANSGKPVAQAPFLRGVKLLHNFQYEEAIEAFQQAQKADPSFALAYWGEAMAHNYTLWAEQHTDLARAVLAKLGPTPEARAAKARTVREKMWLGAVEALYGPGTKFERDEAYADRMDALFAAYPDDLEARVFDALATMGRSHGTRDVANYMKAAAMLEDVFPTHTHHPGVVHYLIHAYDDPTHAPLGLRAARLYNKIAPSSAHAQHMTSHIFLAMGMWRETEEANNDAVAVMNKGMAEHHMAAAACGHGFIWLVYARLQQGEAVGPQVDACLLEAQKLAAATKDLPVVGYPEGSFGSWADMAVRNGVETGQWPKWVELPSGKLTYARFVEDYGRLLASRHAADAAAAALMSMKADRDIMSANFAKEFPDDDTVMPWVDRAVAQGEAVAVLAKGDTDRGVGLLRQAAETESALPPPFGPPALQKPSYELLGDELLALGRKTEAAAAYKQALAAAPGRRLSLAGLKAATTP